MNKIQKWIIGIAVTLLVFTSGFLCYRFWIPIKSFFTKQPYISEEEGQELYDLGYADGNKNEKELQTKVNYYLDLVNGIPNLKDEIQQKELSISALKSEVAGLEKYKAELIARYDELSNIHNACKDTQNGLLNQINNLNISISEKITLIDDMEVEKVILTSQLSEKNLEIIKLKQDINYYEQFIYTLSDSDKVTVKFMYDDSVHAIQVLNKNSIATINNPSSTTYIKFNYWTIDGTTEIDLSTYTLSENTTFVANITKYYDVNFIVDGESVSSQIIEKNNMSTLPGSEPLKAGYVFAGWTLDGTNLVDVANYPITANTIFVAKFTSLNVVEFVFDGVTISTQYIKPGESVEEVNIDSYSENYVFNYWMINGQEIDLSTLVVTNEYTLIVANVTKLFTVTFKVDNVIVGSQKLQENSSVVIPTTPTKDGYRFVGWYVLGKLVDLNSYKITENVTFIAQFTDELNVIFMVDNEEFDTITCKRGNIVSYSTIPEKADCDFIGWSFDGTNVINLSAITITSDNTIFYAVFKVTTLHVTINASNSTLLQRGVQATGVGYMGYKHSVDLSDYVGDSKPFNIGLNMTLGSAVITINELNYSNTMDIHFYTYNYYPTSNNNVYYAFSIEVYDDYIRFAVTFYGNAELCEYDFEANLTMNWIG